MTWKNLNNWLNENKICLNIGKAGVALSKSLKKQTDSGLHTKVMGSDSVKNIHLNTQKS